jgi:hypothetical protein
MNPRAVAANVVWAASSLRAWRRFQATLTQPERVQRQLLSRYLRQNVETAFGQRYRFNRILTASDVVEAYRDAVPFTDYDTLEPSILKIVAGEPNVLTSDAVTRLTPSSGSTSAAKLLPQTDGLQREFARAVDAWIADLFVSRPRLAAGPAYWSVTPAVSFETIAATRMKRSAIPIGFEDDSAYLGGFRRWLVSAILAVPGDVRHIADVESFRYVTLLFLLKAKDLRLLSVWHPSYLIQLLDDVAPNLDRISRDIAAGTLNPPGSLRNEVSGRLAGKLRPDPQRASELRRLQRFTPRDLWPNLGLLSCWGDGPARSYADRLIQALPGTVVQRKGLIATEAIVSIPFQGRHPLAIASHFFEFIDDNGRSRLAHELEQHGQYTVVVTTGGGLYRYKLGDRIAVNSFAASTPSIEFIGRADRVSDRFGEKLSDGFVTTVIDEVFASLPTPRFAMLSPEAVSDGIAYTLLVEAGGPLPSGLDGVLERCLRRNPHYAWCVELGQLLPARVVPVGPGADRTYLEMCTARGQRLGDIKPSSLRTESGWEHALRGVD